ncbi:hypothetical protein, partial [Serratia marcescens]
ALKRRLEAERQGPARLTQKQALALAGVLFREFTAAHDDDPGDADRWFNEHRDDIIAFMNGDDTRRRSAREERFGKLADGLL